MWCVSTESPANSWFSNEQYNTFSYERLPVTGSRFIFSLHSSYISTYYAIFGPTQGIDDATTDDIRVYSQNGVIIVNGTNGETVRVFDILGRMVSTTEGDDIAIPVPVSGVYLIQVGEHPARKVTIVK